MPDLEKPPSSQPESEKDFTAAPPLRHLTIQNRGGSRQHYYHFLLGILLPFARYLAQTGEITVPMIVRSCGPLDTVLHELDLPRLMLAERQSHQNLADSLSPDIARKVGIAGFDIGTGATSYDGEAILAGAHWVMERLRDRTATYRDQFLQKWQGTPRVLVIDRGPADPFYTTQLSERPTRGVGAERRRVSNHKEMVEEVKQRYPACLNIFLEGKPLAAQIALFQLADVVVAQHGAALSNIVWMRRDTSVVELAGGLPGRRFFVDLAPLLNLPHQLFPQDGPFGPVDGVALSGAIGECVSGMRLVG